MACIARAVVPGLPHHVIPRGKGTNAWVVSLSFGDVFNDTARQNGVVNVTTNKAPPSEATVSYAYDLKGQLIGVGDNSATIISPVPPGNSPVANAAYDALNRPLTFSWSPAVTPATSPTASSSAFTFGYNQANQRISQTATDNTWWSYPTATAATVSYTANSLDQYTAVGSVTPTYDGNGNLTFDGTFAYGYDAENRLISASQSGTTVATYAYDAQGNRKSKTLGSATTITLIGTDKRAILDYDGTSGQVQRWYTFGAGPNDVLNQMNVAAGTRTTLVPDTQGSVLASLDSGSGALAKAGYQPFGESSSTSGTFRYTGARIDAETNGLYDFRARMYSPVLGRFLQADPIGTRGGLNLYVYVTNDPLNMLDPFGLVRDTASTEPAAQVSPVWMEVKTGVNPSYTDPQRIVYPHVMIGGLAFSSAPIITQFGFVPGAPLPPIPLYQAYRLGPGSPTRFSPLPLIPD
jgi:RHS repeat-associated protein